MQLLKLPENSKMYIDPDTNNIEAIYFTVKPGDYGNKFEYECDILQYKKHFRFFVFPSCCQGQAVQAVMTGKISSLMNIESIIKPGILRWEESSYGYIWHRMKTTKYCTQIEIQSRDEFLPFLTTWKNPLWVLDELCVQGALKEGDVYRFSKRKWQNTVTPKNHRLMVVDVFEGGCVPRLWENSQDVEMIGRYGLENRYVHEKLASNFSDCSERTAKYKVAGKKFRALELNGKEMTVTYMAELPH